MEEIIIIRALDQGGGLFKTIMDIVYHSSVHIIETRSTVLAFGDIEIHTDCRRVLKAGKDIRINHSEYAMLYCMAKAPGRIYTKEQLYYEAWGEEYQCGMTTVENTIWRLRKKLEPNPKKPIYIKTVFRVGYKIEYAGE